MRSAERLPHSLGPFPGQHSALPVVRTEETFSFTKFVPNSMFPPACCWPYPKARSSRNLFHTAEPTGLLALAL